MPRQRIHLDDIIASAPPLYRINHLTIEGGLRITPRVPLAMLPVGTRREVFFKFWGMDTYDVHTAFSIPVDEIQYPHVEAINYRIVVFGEEGGPSIQANYEHPFKAKVCLGSKGMYAFRTLFALYRALEHLPVLPEDWQYMQFVA